MLVWYILRPLVIIGGHFGAFFPFWYVAPRKIWHPYSKEELDEQEMLSMLILNLILIFFLIPWLSFDSVVQLKRTA
jgi:hypothetical protein